MSKPLISIVSPCYNEEKNIKEHLERTMKSIEVFSDKYNFEHIYTDNDSSDTTYGILTQLAGTFKNLKALRFSRNIGVNRAIFLGLSQARGDAVVLILSDLEDPPELIPNFIKGWEEGYDVVYGKIKSREEGFILKIFKKLYYRLVSYLSEYPIPKDATEFRITSKRVNDALVGLSEDNPYIRGNVAFIGYQQKAIEYTRKKRKAGKSSFNIFGIVSYAIDGLTATTQAPLRLVMILGFFITLLSFVHVAYLVFRKFMVPEAVPLGFVTMITLITFLAGVQILSLGVIGEYIRKIYLQSLKRPKGYIRDSINFKDDE